MGRKQMASVRAVTYWRAAQVVIQDLERSGPTPGIVTPGMARALGHIVGAQMYADGMAHERRSTCAPNCARCGEMEALRAAYERAAREAGCITDDHGDRRVELVSTFLGAAYYAIVDIESADDTPR